MPIIWKAPLKDNGGADYDELDMFDKNVVKVLLQVHKQVDLQDDLSCILVDLDSLINKIEFTDKQKIVLDMWRNGMSLDSISKEFKTISDAVNKMLDTIVGKIIKQYEKEYEDWYYLNIRKGTYKQCSKCGKVKLISQFDIKRSNKDGYKNHCKKCNKL